MTLIIKVPATSANLGPGFDALGLALDLWNETRITPAKEYAVLVKGEGEGRLPTGKHNLIIRMAHKLADRAGKPLPPFRVECINQVPLSSGMGSSATAILTGLLAGNTLLEHPLSEEEILNMASNMEGHSDNVAAAMLGGLVISTTQTGNIIARQIPIAMNIHVTVALPDFYFTTKQARAVLPKRIPLRNAVHNISRTVLVAEAFRAGDLSLLGRVMVDKLHQPYRLKLMPGAHAAMEAAREAGAEATALSGAGPSLIAFSSKAEAGIGESMRSAFEKAGLSTRVFNLRVSSRGTAIQTM